MARMNQTRIVLLAAMACLVLALALLMGATAHATGGYLHMAEANRLAHKVADKTNGVVVLGACRRTSSRTAACPMHTSFRLQGVVCRYTIRVRKAYSRQRGTAWSAKAGTGDCEYVG